MATAKNLPGGREGGSDVDAFMRKLDHPLKPGLQAVRTVILGAHPRIREGIKWNSPSFFVDEYFATINIRKDAVLVILHQGARVGGHGAGRPTIEDPSGLLEWLGTDSAAVTFRDLKAVRSGRAAFSSVVRQWIACLP